MILLQDVERHIPRGWELGAFQSRATDPRQVAVLCRRSPMVSDDMNYVTWRCNTIEGGCHLGHYFDDEQTAQLSFAQRSIQA